MRLLVTRAEPDASVSAAHLRRLGHAVIVAPMLSIEFLPPPSPMSDPAAIALTSANAARALARWPHAARWTAVPVFTVGHATAAAAQAAGFTDIRSAAGGMEELAALIARRFDPAAGPILYPAAETTAGDLAGALAATGFATRTEIAYRALPAARLTAEARSALADRRLDAILFYSERGAATFATLVTREGLMPSLKAVDCLALSGKVAEPVRGLAPRRLEIAPRPDEKSLFTLLGGRA